jgi:long-chain acyl-CoA synthetase
VRAEAENETGKTRAPRVEKTSDEADRIKMPAIAKVPARRMIGTFQREIYNTLYDTEVDGRANIPQNRSCIVVANHTSHLDTGLVKFALGPYGSGLTPLAARDYFFEGNRFKVAFFEHLTNLQPIDRETGSGLAFEQAVDVVTKGHVVLIFPEGTRRTDGTLGDFKPLVGRLSLRTGVDVLPMHLEGAYDALPKGASLPKPGQLKVRIGPPLRAEEMRRLTGDMTNVAAARAATTLIREAVVALAGGDQLELANIASLDDEGRPQRAASRA